MTHAPNVNLLLVDDRPANLLSLQAILDDGEYNLVLARSGAEALNAVLRDEFALILLDIAMPGMDGYEVASLIKDREQSKHVPILFVTASVYDMEHIFRHYPVGPVDYVRKPVDPLGLRAKVAVFAELYRQRKHIDALEARLRAAEERETRGERMRDELLLSAAHELKAHVAPLGARLRALQSGSHPPEVAAGLAATTGDADRLERIVDRLLATSTGVGGESELLPPT